MLTIPRFLVNVSHPIFSHHFLSRFSLGFSHKPFLTSKRFCCYCFETPLMPPSSSSQVVAEYAKSNRSTCKKCSKSIESKTLRLGLVTRDNRGFDMTKWHHLDCFPIDSKLVASPEEIKGFSTLKSSDQEDLKKLLAGQDKAQKNRQRTKDIESEVEESDSKKIKGSDQEDLKKLIAGQDKLQKLGTSDMEARVDVNFSLSDVKNKYKDASLLPKWKAFQTVIFLEQDDGLHDSSKIAAFDFDGCLAKTAVKKVGADAWSLMYSSIPDKLQSLYNDGYKLVIFTNESNIERWKNKRQVAVDSKVGRLNNFIKKVKVPIQVLVTIKLKDKNQMTSVFIACGLSKSGKASSEDPFRKPNPGMWLLMEKHFNSGIAIDMDQSFYVGDAAGRENDHSDADIKFAEAIGLKFFVPEEYFDTKG